MLWRRWLKWLVVVDADRQMVLAQEACSGPYNGSAMLRPLVDAAAHAVTPLGVVLLADAEFSTASTTTATCANSSRQQA